LFSWSDDLGKGFDPGVFGRFDLAALAQPHLKFLFVCLYGMKEERIFKPVSLCCGGTAWSKWAAQA
jgi:hypothetical protein